MNTPPGLNYREEMTENSYSYPTDYSGIKDEVCTN